MVNDANENDLWNMPSRENQQINAREWSIRMTETD
jgi:hypothetical protein